MTASYLSSLRRFILRFGLAAGLVCFLQIVSPQPLIAKPRPPIEMGDPDGTGDEKPGTGPAASIPKSSTYLSGARLDSTASGWKPLRSSTSLLINYLFLIRGLLPRP